MKRIIGTALLFVATAAGAQTLNGPGLFGRMFHRAESPVQVPGPEGLQDYVAAGKLRLSLEDAVRLTLANNTEVRINELQYKLAYFPVQRAHQPFDPMLISSFRPTRATAPTTSSLQGAQTLSDLTQNWVSSYTQTLATGTQYGVSFNTVRSATNSSFSLFNPSFVSSLNFSVTQPLLRRRGLLVNRAPIVIARRNQRQAQASFEAQVNDAIARAVNQYWDVVQARKDLDVLRKSLELAEATYKQNKRALELGALPPLDIYRSESQVAQRKLSVIQSEYRLRQLEDDFRRTIGADLDSNVAALDLALTEPAELAAEPPVLDVQQAVVEAIQRRPEVEAVRQQMASDDLNVQVANNGLKPDLNLTAFYTSNGRGGHQLDSSSGAILSRGGLGDSLDQLGSFEFPTYGVNLEFRLPMRNRAAAADLGTAMVAKRRSLYQLRQREQAVALEVKNAANQLEQSKLSIAAAQVSLDLARKSLAAEERKYELGATTIFFVLEAQTQLTQAEQSMTQAQIGYRRALTAFDRATAALLDKHNVRVQQ